ncbi:hypothetical protein Pogu_ECE009 (plasmid) [Pyrobaculum oguniense TE7]|uniref:Uncharacterized protein n=1 Tax=Pyrobaculum oguniense (strain DSM 13380 / JCM 10595 / TE7) TaxID=698757 RepID=H6QE06_PYROT|nr:hypothetical protein Pogu_ECE009 [Pyrobaculum oguniense TE7]
MSSLISYVAELVSKGKDVIIHVREDAVEVYHDEDGHLVGSTFPPVKFMDLYKQLVGRFGELVKPPKDNIIIVSKKRYERLW